MSDGEYPRLREWTRNDSDHPFYPNRASGAGLSEAFEVVLDDLERAAPDGLVSRRSTFWDDRRNADALLNLRVELVIGSALARHHVDFRYSQGSPDIVCSVAGREWGLEVTARRRDDVAALHNALETALADGPDVQALIRRTDGRFKFDASRKQEIVDAVLDAARAGRGGAAFGWAGLAVDIYPASGIGPGLKVAWEPVHDLEIHWPGVALELTSRICEKAGKQYPVPTIAVVDITRLGESGKWALDTLPADTLVSQITADLAGPLAGVAVVRAGFLQAAGFEVAATWRNPSAEDCDDALDMLRAVARPALPLTLARHLKASVPAGTLRSWIAGELLAVGTQRRAETASRTCRFTDNVPADELLRSEPFAALVGILCQQWRVRAGQAWQIPWLVQRHLGYLEPRRITAHASEVRDQLQASAAIRPHTIEIIVRAAQRVASEYDGDALAVWNSASAPEIMRRIRCFYGAGPKISQMAPSILKTMYGTPRTLDTDIAVDRNVARVFGRLGLVSAPATRDQVQDAARDLNPAAPAELDLGTWVLGSEICTAKTPACYRCPLLPACPRNGIDAS